MKNEIWRPVVGYEGLYEVSNFGRVKSLARLDSIGRIVVEKILKTSLRSGYPSISLCKNGIIKSATVHRLVWEAFNGPIPEGMEVNHIDQNQQNNHLENLNILTHTDNLKWGSRLELVSAALTNSPKLSKPVIQYDLEGNIVQEWPSAAEAARQLNLFKTNISAACNGKVSQTGGFRK